MRLWVVGHRGMLGAEVSRIAVERGHVVWHCPDPREIHSPLVEAIINCAGKRPGQAGAVEMIDSNASLPHWLASYGVPLVHMSTDCVFSGKQSGWLHKMNGVRPDPIDLYGRSKLVGEVKARHVTVVRGSFIGLLHGFLPFVLGSKGTIDAWSGALWNGTTVDIMAGKLVDLAESGRGGGVVQAATGDIHSKADLVTYIVNKLDLPVSIRYMKEPEINRRLSTDIQLPSIYPSLDRLLEQVCQTASP